MSPQSIVLRSLLTFFLLPLVYLSGVRLFSQIIIPTDSSSLWPTPSPTVYYRPEVLTSVLKHLLILNPLSTDYQTLLARSFVEKNDPNANNSIHRTIYSSVANPGGWVLLGTLLGSRGRFDEGFAMFERALLLNPSRPETYRDAGLYLYDALPLVALDRRSLYRNLAELNLNLSLNLDPSLSVDPHLCLAMASIMAERTDTGRAVFWLKRTVLRRPVEWSFAVRKMALCFYLGEGVEAIASWKQVFVPGEISEMQIRLIETEIKKYMIPDFRYFLAELYVTQNKPEAAEKELVSLVGIRPNVPEYRIALGNVYERLHRSPEARLCYEKALQLSPANQEAKKKLVEYYTKERRYP